MDEAVSRPDEFARILTENERYADSFDRSALTSAPLSGLAVVACMDARLDVHEALGLRTGDAHVIRNAGGIVTDDVIRSLIVSQQLGGTDRVIVIEHTACKLLGADDAQLQAMVGADEAFFFGGFPDLEANLRAQVDLLRSHPWIKPVEIRGLIFDVSTGRLREVV